MWYRWTAYNSQTHYGWTQDEAIADAIVANLNRGREINLYSRDELTDAEAETLGLADNSELLCDDDTTLDEVVALFPDEDAGEEG